MALYSATCPQMALDSATCPQMALGTQNALILYNMALNTTLFTHKCATKTYNSHVRICVRIRVILVSLDCPIRG